MEKLNSSLKNMVCVLVGVALVTGGLLAVVNNVTKDPKAAKAEQTLAEGIKSVMGTDKITVSSTDSVNNNENGKDRLYIIHNVSDADSKPIGAAVETIGQGFGGDLKVLVGFSMDARYWDIPYCNMQRLQVLVPRQANGSRKVKRVTS